MASATAGSVSKGVFVFKGKKTKAKAEDYFVDDRMYTCDALWEKLSESIQVLQSDLNVKIFEDLLLYIDNAYRDWAPATGGHKRQKAKEIPTAALVTGVNMPDHALMFSNLVSQVRECVSTLTAVLHSKDCLSIKAIMSKTVAQLMDSPSVLEEDAEAEVEHTPSSRISCVMSTLVSWYKQIGMDRHSPRKRQASGSPRKRSPSKAAATAKASTSPPLVIVLEDLESFPTHVLQDFITICSNHIHEIPIVLVFGIATTVTAVHRLLPHDVSSLLCMEKFQAPPSSEYLTKVIQQVLLTADFPFKLGPKVFLLLLDIFLYHDFSVVNFIRGLQFSLLDHFTCNPSSVLCQLTSDLDEDGVLSELSHAQLEEIRSNLSFRRYVEGQAPKEQIALLEDDEVTKTVMMKCLVRLDHYHQCFYPVLHCLHAMTGRLPGHPLGKQPREIYSMCLSADICDTSDYKEVVLLLRALSRDELLGMLRQCCIHVNADHLPRQLHKVNVKLMEFADKFANIERLSQEYDEAQQEQQQQQDDEVGGEAQAGSSAQLPKKMDMYTLRQKLQAMDKKKKKLSLYEVVRNETIDYMDSVFRQYLTNPSKLPLHEVMYYNNVTAIRTHINGSPRATIQNALSNPYHYLQNEALKQEGGTISHTLPDLCIIYKLHTECGRLINLYDWLQAFVTIVTAEDEDDAENDPSTRKPDKLLQARFIRAVSELQFLGFVKPTKRKTDHVARLTWGGC